MQYNMIYVLTYSQAASLGMIWCYQKYCILSHMVTWNAKNWCVFPLTTYHAKWGLYILLYIFIQMNIYVYSWKHISCCFLFSCVSSYLLLVYKNAINICILTSYLPMFPDSCTSYNRFFYRFLELFT